MPPSATKLDPTIPPPASGRTYAARRRVRLADMDATGRVRFDALARFLQDIAIDDVQETGWGTPRHLWFVRRIRVDVLVPLAEDRELELTTWCSGVATLAAGRRWSVVGDRGGRAEIDSIWVHLDADQRPARIVDFGVYAEATGGRAVTTRLALGDPPPRAARALWQLRSSDVDLHGHVNNAVHWQAVEDVLAREPGRLRGPICIDVEYREPLEPGDVVELATDAGDAWLCVGNAVRAAIRIELP